MSNMSREDLLGLAGRVVMITGAGRGFGRSIALAYGRSGATVIVVDADVDQATEVASQIEELGATAIPIRGDMSVSLDVVTTFSKIEELFGMLDGIVHVTHTSSRTPFVELLESEWYDLLNSDVKSSLYTLQHGLKYLAGGGFVVVVMPPANNNEPHIASVRGAMRGLIEGSRQVFPKILRVNGVVPSREAAGAEHDQPLARAVVALGSMVSEGIHGEIVEVELPEAPQPPELYDVLSELP